MSNQTKSGQESGSNVAEITLGVLNAVENSSSVTQRSVAGELNIALGLANSYLKRCVKKGFIKIKHAPRNRYAYYLTPKGFAEKSRLTGEYLSQSFNFFRMARSQCGDLFTSCVERGWLRVALAGVGDLAEIATLCARDHEIKIVGIIDSTGHNKGDFAGLRAVSEPTELGHIDAVIITDMIDPQNTFDMLLESCPDECLLSMSFMNISRVLPEMIED